MDCKRVREAIYLFIDGEMEDGLKKPFERHLECCESCDHRATYTQRVLVIFRERCVRHHASNRLRERILMTLHRSPGNHPENLA